jgi:hypothetical protein
LAAPSTAERDVRVGVAAKVKAIGTIEDALVTVGRDHPQRQAVTARHRRGHRPEITPPYRV